MEMGSMAHRRSSDETTDEDRQIEELLCEAPGYEYKPIQPPDGFLPLDFRPTMLKTSVALSVAVLYTAMIAVIIALLYCGDDKRSFHVRNIHVYLCARYVPSVIGTITLILVRSTLQDFRRLLPYLQMADQKNGSTGSAKAIESIAAFYFPTFGIYTYMAFVIAVLTQSAFYMASLKVGLLEIVSTGQSWVVIAHAITAYLLIAYYIFHVLVLLAMIFWLWNRQTGLRSGWDPTSLADIIAIFRHFNVDMPSTYVSSKDRDRASSLDRYGGFRLGYWERTCGESHTTVDIVYGVRGLSNKQQ